MYIYWHGSLSATFSFMMFVLVIFAYYHAWTNK